MSNQWLANGVLLTEVPVFTGLVWAAVERRLRSRQQVMADISDKLSRALTRLELDGNDDVARDRALAEVRKRQDADHDLLIEWVGWGERHDTWSRERWEDHMRQWHHKA